MYVKFWKWLAYPELSANERKKKVPDIVKDIPLFKRKEKTNVQVSDLWTPRSENRASVYALVLWRNEGRCNFCGRKIKENEASTRRFASHVKYYHAACAAFENSLIGTRVLPAKIVS